VCEKCKTCPPFLARHDVSHLCRVVVSLTLPLHPTHLRSTIPCDVKQAWQYRLHSLCWEFCCAVHTGHDTHPYPPHLSPPRAGDGRCVVCDSFVRPATLVRICDECNYGSYQGRCVICGNPGVSDAYYCKECTIQEKDVSDHHPVLVFTCTLLHCGRWTLLLCSTLFPSVL
jgi:hypothetical protein